jgi:hypothetical protein
MTNKKVIIPADATQLINQLRAFQRIQTKTTIKYQAPEGQHDDYVISLALTIYAALKPATNIKIYTGFWKRTIPSS